MQIFYKLTHGKGGIKATLTFPKIVSDPALTSTTEVFSKYNSATPFSQKNLAIKDDSINGDPSTYHFLFLFEMSTVTSAEVQICENFIDYHFKDPSLLQEALQPAGTPVRYSPRPHHDEGNKRLVDLGRKLHAFLTSKCFFESGGMMRKPCYHYNSVKGYIHTDRQVADLDPEQFEGPAEELAAGDEFMEFIVEVQGDERSTGRTIIETQQAIFAAAWCDGGFDAYVKVFASTLQRAGEAETRKVS